MTSTDHELVQAWRTGDREAGEELARRHFAAVYRFFVGKLDDRVDDLTQRTFLACVERRDKLREDLSLRAYLLGIARNLLFTELRRLHVETRAQDLGQLPIGELVTPSRAIAAREEQRLLLLALRRIPLDFQIALELFYWEELPITEIAAVLEVADGTVKSRLSRGRTMLREQIERMEVSQDLMRSTLDNLEGWARSMHGSLGKPE